MEGQFSEKINFKLAQYIFLIFFQFTFPNLKAESFEIISSTLWQTSSPDEGKKILYPSGVPVVLEKQELNKTFNLRLEQYYSEKISSDKIKIYVHGNWAFASRNPLISAKNKHPHLRISPTKCDESTGLYRCIIDMRILSNIPSGNIGISLSYNLNDNEVFSPDSLFRIIVLENSGLATQKSVNRSDNSIQREYISQSKQESNPELFEHLTKSVVRIGINKQTILGSGFILAEPSSALNFFAQRNHLGALDYLNDGFFILTAAHLFPNFYTPLSTTGNIFKTIDLKSNHYSIGFSDPILPTLKAELVALSIDADLAMLYVSNSELHALKSANESFALQGLTLATEVQPYQSYFVAGFPIYLKGQMTFQTASLNEIDLNTHETANFGPLTKFKLSSSGQNQLAHAGMSGGPIINSWGAVVGLAIEKPNIGNSLVAIDLTQVDDLEFDEVGKNCFINFNPFERTLSLINDDKNCAHQDFGFEENLSPLKGRWFLQEILGQSEEPGVTIHKYVSGQSIIHGHTIITKPALVNGKAAYDSSLDFYDLNIEEINAQQMNPEFKLDPLSFETFWVKGIRIINASFETTQLDPAIENQVIVGIKDDVNNDSFREIRSVRDFTIWLKRNQHDPNINLMLCTGEMQCAKQSNENQN